MAELDAPPSTSSLSGRDPISFATSSSSKSKTDVGVSGVRGFAGEGSASEARRVSVELRSRRWSLRSERSWSLTVRSEKSERELERCRIIGVPSRSSSLSAERGAPIRWTSRSRSCEAAGPSSPPVEDFFCCCCCFFLRRGNRNILSLLLLGVARSRRVVCCVALLLLRVGNDAGTRRGPWKRARDGRTIGRGAVRFSEALRANGKGVTYLGRLNQERRAPLHVARCEWLCGRGAGWTVSGACGPRVGLKQGTRFKPSLPRAMCSAVDSSRACRPSPACGAREKTSKRGGERGWPSRDEQGGKEVACGCGGEGRAMLFISGHGSGRSRCRGEEHL